MEVINPKTSREELKLEDLKEGQVYRGKKPKLIGLFDSLVDDRQILYIAPNKSVIEYIDRGYNPNFIKWCKENGKTLTYSSDQFEFEKDTDEDYRNIEPVMDYLVQFDSPSVRLGRKQPMIPATKFLKWARRNVTDLLPKGEWASSL